MEADLPLMCGKVCHCRVAPCSVLLVITQILTAQFTHVTLSTTPSWPPKIERTSVVLVKVK